MKLSTQICFHLLLLASTFSCIRREQAYFQPSQREQFVRQKPTSVTTPEKVIIEAETQNQAVSIQQPETSNLVASATSTVPDVTPTNAWEEKTKITTQVTTTPNETTKAIKLTKEQRKAVLKKIATESGNVTSGLAIASLVSGILSLFVLGVILGPLAIIFGAIALSKIRKNPDMKGRGLAIAGLIIGIVATVLIVVYLASR